MKLKKPRWFISLYTGWLHVLGLQYEKRHITLETLRINFASLYHGKKIIKIALAIVAPSNGANSRVMWGKQSPLRNPNVFWNKYSRARHSWKAAFYLIFFIMQMLSVRPSVRPSVHPSIHLSIYLSICLSVCLSIYLSIYLSMKLSAKKLIIFKWSQAQVDFFKKLIWNMLCLCAAQLKFWIETDLGCENSGSYYRQGRQLLLTSRHGHALVTLYVQFLCSDWSKFDRWIHAENVCCILKLVYFAEADRVLCQLVMFLTVFFHWMYKMKFSCYQESSVIHG